MKNADPEIPRDQAPGPWVIRCREDRHAAAEAARVVLDAFVRAGEVNFGIALSGGRIAPVLFGEFCRQAEARQVGLAAADFFWADERCVPPTHEESNFRVAKAALLDRLEVPAAHVHRLPGELPTERAVRQAREDWAGWLKRRGPERAWLDVVLLGVGEDGHVASLFPENLATDVLAPEPIRAVVGPKPPPQRLTFGYPVLWSARLVVVLATGTGKWDVVNRALTGREDLPLRRVLEGRRGRETVVIGHR